MIITDGNQSYAFFTYICGNINWGSDVAIGFKGEDIFFENYELGNVTFTDTDCISPPVTNTLFHLTPDEIPRSG